jgi:hypothetical protein
MTYVEKPDLRYCANDRHWMTTLPLSYLKKGDRFTLQSNGVLAKVASGVADMDGHSVSASYGLRAGGTYYEEHPHEDYINVRWDGIDYSPAAGYHSGLPTNHSLYPKDGKVYVSREIADRVAKDRQYNIDLKNGKFDKVKSAVNEQKKRDLLAQVTKIEKQIREL